MQYLLACQVEDRAGSFISVHVTVPDQINLVLVVQILKGRSEDVHGTNIGILSTLAGLSVAAIIGCCVGWPVTPHDHPWSNSPVYLGQITGHKVPLLSSLGYRPLGTAN